MQNFNINDFHIFIVTISNIFTSIFIQLKKKKKKNWNLTVTSLSIFGAFEEKLDHTVKQRFAIEQVIFIFWKSQTWKLSNVTKI